jgi:hypothetical protein
MALDSQTNVEKIQSVENENGKKVPASSDDYRHAYGHDEDVGTGEIVQLTAPDRAEAITVHVEGWGSNGGEVAVRFMDPDGQRITSRTASDSDAFESIDGSDVFVEVAVASPFIEIEITGADDPDTASYTVYLR